MRVWKSTFLSLVGVGLVAGAVLAQSAAPSTGLVIQPRETAVPSTPKALPAAPDFGTTGFSSVRIPAFDFSTLHGGAYAWPGGGIGRYPNPNDAMEAAVHVPGGAMITRVELDYCDTNATNHITIQLAVCDNNGQNCSAGSSVLTSGGDGCQFVSQNGLGVTVDNYNNMYMLQASFGATDGTNSLNGAIITYQLQVSPAPGSSDFADVPTSDFGFQYIEALFASGITGGCGGGNYCPDSPVTRRQMAIFLAKSLGLFWNYN